MSPLDDELRGVLRRRADVLPPPVDPLAGIEHRAHAIRRRRRTATAAASALAVAALAAGVPLVAHQLDVRGHDRPIAGEPTGGAASASPHQAQDVDVADPLTWPVRGDRSLVDSHGAAACRALADAVPQAGPAKALWAGRSASGDLLVLVVAPWHGNFVAGVWRQPPAGEVTVVGMHDLPHSPGAVSAVVPPYRAGRWTVVVVGAPGTTRIVYAPHFSQPGFTVPAPTGAVAFPRPVTPRPLQDEQDRVTVFAGHASTPAYDGVPGRGLTFPD